MDVCAAKGRAYTRQILSQSYPGISRAHKCRTASARSQIARVPLSFQPVRSKSLSDRLIARVPPFSPSYGQGLHRVSVLRSLQLAVRCRRACRRAPGPPFCAQPLCSACLASALLPSRRTLSDFTALRAVTTGSSGRRLFSVCAKAALSPLSGTDRCRAGARL